MQKKIIFLILSLLFSQFSIYYVNSREKDNLNIQLKDPLIDNLPFFKGLDKFYDLTVLPPLFLSLMYYQKIPIENMIPNLSAILVLRGLCILTTSIPKFNSCQQKNNKDSLLFSGGCYDKILRHQVNKDSLQNDLNFMKILNPYVNMHCKRRSVKIVTLYLSLRDMYHTK